MWKKTKRKQLCYGLILGMLVFLLVSPLAVAASHIGALTPPPPDNQQLQGFPNYDYLYNGKVTFTDLGNRMIEIAGTTYAYSVVDSIGLTIILERWTGSRWEEVDRVQFSNKQAKTYSNSARWIVTSGYYYRGKTLHWVRMGNKYEEDQLVSGSLLIN